MTTGSSKTLEQVAGDTDDKSEAADDEIDPICWDGSDGETEAPATGEQREEAPVEQDDRQQRYRRDCEHPRLEERCDNTDWQQEGGGNAEPVSRLDVEVVDESPVIEHDLGPGDGASEQICGDHGAERPAFEVCDLEILDQQDGVPRLDEPATELDVLDARLTESLVETPDLEKCRAPHRAASRPEGRGDRASLLVHPVVQQVPILREETRVPGLVVVRADDRGGGVVVEEFGNPGGKVRGNHDIGIDERDDVELDCSDRPVARPRGSAALVEDEHGRAEVSPDRLERLIRTVDNHDELPRPRIEGGEGPSALPPSLSAAAHRNDDSHVGGGVFRPSVRGLPGHRGSRTQAPCDRFRCRRCRDSRL